MNHREMFEASVVLVSPERGAITPARPWRGPKLEITSDHVPGFPRGAIVYRDQLLEPGETQPPFHTIDRLVDEGAIRLVWED